MDIDKIHEVEYIDTSSLEKKRIRTMKKIEGKKSAKVSIHAYIPYELYQKVIETAPRVFGISRGSFSYAVEKALTMWLETVGKNEVEKEQGGEIYEHQDRR